MAFRALLLAALWQCSLASPRRFAANTCSADELDLCAGTGWTTKCKDDEMDLCEGTGWTTKCMDDEMDLCEGTGWTLKCKDDEMDLCPLPSPGPSPPGQGPSPGPSPPGQGPSPAPTSFKGNMKVKVAGVTQAQMVTAMKKTLAVKFTVNSNQVDVTATETRRLAEASRRLAGNWNIDFTISQLDADKLAAVRSTADSYASNPGKIIPEMVKQLNDAGAKDVTTSSLEVSSFIAKKPGDIDTASSAYPMTTPLSIGIALLATAFLKPETLNMFSSLVPAESA